MPTSRSLARPLAWAALLAAGQAATLAMIRAGNTVGYQHYVAPWELRWGAPAWALAVFAIEVAAVALLLWRRRHEVATLLRGAGPLRLLLVATAFVLTSATLSRAIGTYLAELVFASFVQLAHLGAVAGFALALDRSRLDRFRAIADRVLGPAAAEAHPGGPDRFTWCLAAFVTAVAALLAIVSYQRHPHVPDEVVYLIQARYLAAGHLTVPLPAVPDAFNVDLMMYQATRWFSPVPPGWPFLLAIGAFFGAAWLVNPLLGGLNVLLAAAVLRECYPRRTARLALLLFAVSPWNLFMAMNLMTHTAALTAALVAAGAVARMRRDPRLRWAVLGGFGIALVGLIRPLEGMAVALLLGFWSLGIRGHRFRLAPAVALTLATIVASATVLPYNRYLTGSATTFPIMAYTDATYGPGTNALGFGANRGLGWPGLDPLPGHGPLDVLINANFNLFQTNTELLGWATGSLLIIAMLLAWGRLRRADWWMLAVLAMVAGIHSFYYFSGGPDFGARYWYLIIVPCLALAARGLETLGDRGGEPARSRILAATALLVAVTLLVFVPWRATDKYYHYRLMEPGARMLAADPRLRDGVVLVRGRRHPDYASAVVYNPVDSGGHQPLFAWDRGDTVRQALVAAFPRRRFWIVDGPTVSGDGYQVVAGPLDGAALLSRHDPPVAEP